MNPKLEYRRVLMGSCDTGSLLIRVYPCLSVSNDPAHRKIIAVETWAVEFEHGWTRMDVDKFG